MKNEARALVKDIDGKIQKLKVMRDELARVYGLENGQAQGQAKRVWVKPQLKPRPKPAPTAVPAPVQVQAPAAVKPGTVGQALVDRAEALKAALKQPGLVKTVDRATGIVTVTKAAAETPAQAKTPAEAQIPPEGGWMPTLIKYLDERGPSKRSDILRDTGINANTLNVYLSKAARDGVFVRIGEGWGLPKPVQAPKKVQAKPQTPVAPVKSQEELEDEELEAKVKALEQEAVDEAVWEDEDEDETEAGAGA